MSDAWSPEAGDTGSPTRFHPAASGSATVVGVPGGTVAVAVGVRVGVGVRVAVAVGVDVRVAVALGVCVGVGVAVEGAATTVTLPCIAGWNWQKYANVPSTSNAHSNDCPLFSCPEPHES